jgi:hypothetical protein
MDRPKKPIRRFDVFAEYQRLEAMKEGMPPEVAKGRGLWLAKVVAARKFRRTRAGEAVDERRRARPEREPDTLVDGKWHTLGDEPQTDALFDKEIVDRMGRSFYDQVFTPAIQEAFQKGMGYQEIRDSIREAWKP